MNSENDRRGIIEQKRFNPQDDILTNLIGAEAEGEKLSEDELVAMVFLLIAAGYETTVYLIINSVLTLLQHPDQLARLRAEPALIDSAVEEFCATEVQCKVQNPPMH